LQPEGLFIENYETLNPLNLKEGEGNFYMKPNGVFYITDENKAYICEAAKFPKGQKNIKYALQSGPLLFLNSFFHSLFNQCSENKLIRNGVGIIDENTVVFIISKNGVNFFSFSEIFMNYFGCKNALYLDGIISNMYLPEIKSISALNSTLEYATFISVTEKN
jgi:uncharacterized protein YigE (DUF2233 family)